MTNTKRIVRADLDEIVEAVVGEINGLNDIRDIIIAEDQLIVIKPSQIRTAIERFVVDSEDATDIDAWNSALDEMNNTTPKKGGEDEG